MYESLHNHTTASDGAQTYEEVLATAHRAGFGTIAFTDHDVVPNEAELKRLRAYDGPVQWLLGCEVSSGLPKELGGTKGGSIHVLGLFTDPTNQALLEHSRRAVAARTERMECMVANLRNLGFTISIDDCWAASGGENVARPHIVKALNAHPHNAAILDGLKVQMEAAAKSDPDVAMDYMHMLSRRPSDYPYALFLSDEAFIKGVYVDYLYAIDLDDSVALIRQAGGRAALAHWWTYRRKINFEALEGLLHDGRLDFVETCSGQITDEVVRYGRQAAELAERFRLPQAIGIDGHLERDIIGYGRERVMMEDSIGQTQRFIETYHPNLSWSSLKA